MEMIHRVFQLQLLRLVVDWVARTIVVGDDGDLFRAMGSDRSFEIIDYRIRGRVVRRREVSHDAGPGDRIDVNNAETGDQEVRDRTLDSSVDTTECAAET